MCFAKKAGFALDRYKVDREAFVKLLDQEKVNDQEFLEQLKENCINGDFNNYGPSQLCELTKLKICIDITA